MKNHYINYGIILFLFFLIMYISSTFLIIKKVEIGKIQKGGEINNIFTTKNKIKPIELSNLKTFYIKKFDNNKDDIQKEIDRLTIKNENLLKELSLININKKDIDYINLTEIEQEQYWNTEGYIEGKTINKDIIELKDKIYNIKVNIIALKEIL